MALVLAVRSMCCHVLPRGESQAGNVVENGELVVKELHVNHRTSIQALLLFWFLWTVPTTSFCKQKLTPNPAQGLPCKCWEQM